MYRVSSTRQHRTKTTRWTPDETRRFYMALRQCGTDFTTMELMFPTRDRAQLKVRRSPTGVALSLSLLQEYWVASWMGRGCELVGVL